LRLALHLNPATVEIDDAMNGGQPQARTFFLRRKKREKDLV
jgi:hypothetical protein